MCRRFFPSCQVPPRAAGRKQAALFIAESNMPTEQYHKPPEELLQKVRTYARMITSLIEEAEAISWVHTAHRAG